MGTMKPKIIDAEKLLLREGLVQALDVGCRSSDEQSLFRERLRAVLVAYGSDVVHDCLREVESDASEQIAVLEHRLAMIVEAHAEIAKQGDPLDPLRRLETYLRGSSAR
jgi:hypothetical protein